MLDPASGPLKVEDQTIDREPLNGEEAITTWFYPVAVAAADDDESRGAALTAGPIDSKARAGTDLPDKLGKGGSGSGLSGVTPLMDRFGLYSVTLSGSSLSLYNLRS